MKRTRRECTDCNTETEQRVMGFVPEFFLLGDENSVSHGTWVRVTVCTECGTLHRVGVTEEEIERADRRYVKALVDEGVISKDDGREILGEIQ